MSIGAIADELNAQGQAHPPGWQVAQTHGDQSTGPAVAAASWRGVARQSRLVSLVEALANVFVGYGVAVITQLLLFPIFGLMTSLGENMAIGAVFTAISKMRRSRGH